MDLLAGPNFKTLLPRALTRKTEPAIERRRTPRAASARLDAKCMRRSLEDVAEADFIIIDEPRKANSSLLLVIFALVAILRFLFLHRALPQIAFMH
jgi:hypothetical protein